MNFDDYIAQTLEDGKKFIDENYKRYTDFQELFDDLQLDDSVTGNMSGSYTFSSYKAKENVADVIWDDDFNDELCETGANLSEIIKHGPEEVDVWARCLAVNRNYSELEKYYNDCRDVDE